MEGFQGFGLEESGEDSDGMLQYSAALNRVCDSTVEPTPDGAIVKRERALPDYATQVQNVSRGTTHLQQPAMSTRETEQRPSASSSAETESIVQQAVGASIAQATSTLTILSHTDHDEMEERQRLHHQSLCKTCFQENASIMFLPCTHLSACPECAAKLQNCNVCQQHIKTTVRAYYF